MSFCRVPLWKGSRRKVLSFYSRGVNRGAPFRTAFMEIEPPNDKTAMEIAALVISDKML
jgi:hypothetical protein